MITATRSKIRFLMAAAILVGAALLCSCGTTQKQMQLLIEAQQAQHAEAVDAVNEAADVLLSVPNLAPDVQARILRAQANHRARLDMAYQNALALAQAMGLIDFETYHQAILDLLNNAATLFGKRPASTAPPAAAVAPSGGGK
jgi:hypothetical protein